ncbi:restriction endonuclease [Haloferax massiliensis]|uniref:DNA polymerase IV n=1 Tax=Haloferax massiliensis TaxID=1476858 RepID=A0A0D6JLG2_9EURY|nr:restriction endonuclease [Haloferax massiliensis]CQR48752.1 DNA polymerase IV [Haloferax massiliensis]
MGGAIHDIRSKLYELEWQEFERFVADLWTIDGWTTEVTGGNDEEGEDIRATKSIPFEMEVLIQTKAYREGNKVQKNQVEQYAPYRGAEFDHMVVVTSSSFTKPAIKRSQDNRTKIVDGESLAEYIQYLDAEELLDDYLKADDASQLNVSKYIVYDEHVRPLKDIRGIGQKKQTQLNDAGIYTVTELANRDPAQVASETQLTENSLKKWVREAAFQDGKYDIVKAHSPQEDIPVEVIDGIGERYAERLVDAGIHTVADLSIAKPEEVAERSDISENHLETWGKLARYHES